MKAKLFASHKTTALVQTLAVPLGVILLMNLITVNFAGVWTITSSADIKSLSRTVIMTMCYALGLNSNFAMGRMDMSAGSQMYLGCIVGGNIALALNLDGIGVLLFSMVVGGLAGLLGGILFVRLRILPMILGL